MATPRREQTPLPVTVAPRTVAQIMAVVIGSLALVAFVFAAHELRCVRALDRQMGALDKVITPRR